MNARWRDSVSSIVGLTRVACILAAIFDGIGVVWFVGSQPGLLRVVMWPAPFLALIYGGLAPKKWLADVVGLAIGFTLSILAIAELLRRSAIYWSATGEGSAFSFVIDLLEIGLVVLVLLGRVFEGRFERPHKGSESGDVAGSETPK